MTRPDLLTKEQLLERHSRILFGAPGTGKSYYLNVNSKKDVNGEKIFDENNIERVTFYPRYSYGQFVGLYKPVPSGDAVTYRYVPGPFMRTYAKAKKNYMELDSFKKNIDNKFKDINFFLFPTNPDEQWNLFENIQTVCEEEEFTATKEAKIGDIGLVYVKRSKVLGDKPNGIYAIAKVVNVYDDGKRIIANLRFIKLFYNNIKIGPPLIDYKNMQEKLKDENKSSQVEIDELEKTDTDKEDINPKDNGKEVKKESLQVRSRNKIGDRLKKIIIEQITEKGLDFYREDRYLLIIEELNRANAASVFGDIFQLLDRKAGKSTYPITTSEEARDYLAKEFYGCNYEDCTPAQRKECETMCIPSNMYIWATMNSADQGVEVLDTAFKRRWEYEYIGINESEGAVNSYYIPVCIKEDINTKKAVTVQWNALRNKINDSLSNCFVKEDKLLGPFFLSEEKLKSVECKNDNGKDTLDVKIAEEFINAFKSKVLMYLFDDAAAGNINEIFKNNPKRYSTICDSFNDYGIEIFKFNEQLETKTIELTTK